jgi:hypothetical protein
MEAMPQANCMDCKGSGMVRTQGLILGRTMYDKKKDKLVIDCTGDGIWQDTQCPCVGEDDA